MSTKTFYPNKVTQTTGGKYRTFKDLAVIKNAGNGYAVSNGNIKGKKSSPNRPSTITCTDFRCKLPVGSIVNSITVEVKHSKDGSSNQKSCNIPAPTVSLMYNGHVAYSTNVSGATRYDYSKKGQAPKMVVDSFTDTFNGKATVNKKTVKYTMLSRSVVNDSSFGVRVNYPTNSNEYEGTVKVYWVRVKVNYTTSSFAMSMAKVSGGYNGEEYKLKTSINRTSKTDHIPSVTIVSPTGASFKGASGGSVTMVDNHIFTWTPSLSSSVATSKASVELTFEVNVTYASGQSSRDIVFECAESLNGASASHTAHITDKPDSSSTGDDDTTENLNIDENVPTEQKTYTTNYVGGKFDLTITIPDGTYTSSDVAIDLEIYSIDSDQWVDFTNFKFYIGDTELDKTKRDPSYISTDGYYFSGTLKDLLIAYNRFNDNSITITIEPLAAGEYRLKTWVGGISEDAYNDIYWSVVSTSLTTPSMTILQPTNEELDRLGDGYSYTVQSYLEEIQPYTETTLFSDSTERSLSNSTSNAKTYTIPSSTLTNLPNNFELTFKFKGANNFTSRLILMPTSEYVEDSQQSHYLYCGKSREGNIDVGARSDGVTDYVYGASMNTEYHTFKIIRTDMDTFKFYVDDTLLSTKTVEWFKNYNSFDLTLINWGNGATCSADDITLKSQSPVESYVRDWYKNFRIGVYNNPIGTTNTYTVIDENGEEQSIEYNGTDYNNLTPTQIFTNAEYWSNCPTSVNTYTNLECHFQYDEDYPLYIIIVGDYLEATNTAEIKYTEPCIIETASYKQWETNGKYPVPIRNLLSNGDTAQLQLEAYQTSSPIVLYDFPLDEDFGTDEDTAIRGVELTGNIEQSDKQTLQAQLINPQNETGERSIIITDIDTRVDNDVDFTVGGQGDLFGFGMLDFTGLNEWQIQLQLSNIIGDTTSNINLNDLQLTYYTETIEHQNIDVYVNDENIAFYNAFITDVNIPPGLETDVSFLTIDGTDTNDAYRQNIREKTITLECEVGETCDLETNTQTLRQLIRLFTNDKDKYNRPIPKRIRFSHYPDVYFEYILKDSPDVTIDINTYNVKMNLVVPSGTSYDINSTVTGTTGYAQGLVGVEPIIQVTPTDNTIKITETISGQTFHMGYTDWIGKIVEIDCEDRIVWLKETEDDTDPTNISSYVDFNSDWFVLKGEYHFETVNSILKTVSYIERE